MSIVGARNFDFEKGERYCRCCTFGDSTIAPQQLSVALTHDQNAVHEDIALSPMTRLVKTIFNTIEETFPPKPH